MRTHLQLLDTMVRWEVRRMYHGQGSLKRILLGFGLFLGWLTLTGATMRWQFQWPLMVMLLPVFPLVFVIGYVADSFAGERERGTLEALLLSPVPDWAIVAGKVIALMLVSLLMCAVLLTAHAIVAVMFGISSLALQWYARALVVGAIMYLIVICFGMIVSWRARSVQAAQQMLPVVFIVLSAVVFLSPYVPVSIRQWVQQRTFMQLALGGTMLALGSVGVAISTFRRDRLLLRS